MKRLLRGTLRHRNSPTGEEIQNGRPTDEIPKDPPLFCPCFSLSPFHISLPVIVWLINQQRPSRFSKRFAIFCISRSWLGTDCGLFTLTIVLSPASSNYERPRGVLTMSNNRFLNMYVKSEAYKPSLKFDWLHRILPREPRTLIPKSVCWRNVLKFTMLFCPIICGPIQYSLL